MPKDYSHRTLLLHSASLHGSRSKDWLIFVLLLQHEDLPREHLMRNGVWLSSLKKTVQSHKQKTLNTLYYLNKLFKCLKWRSVQYWVLSTLSSNTMWESVENNVSYSDASRICWGVWILLIHRQILNGDSQKDAACGPDPTWSTSASESHWEVCQKHAIHNCTNTQINLYLRVGGDLQGGRLLVVSTISSFPSQKPLHSSLWMQNWMAAL